MKTHQISIVGTTAHCSCGYSATSADLDALTTWQANHLMEMGGVGTTHLPGLSTTGIASGMRAPPESAGWRDAHDELLRESNKLLDALRADRDEWKRRAEEAFIKGRDEANALRERCAAAEAIIADRSRIDVREQGRGIARPASEPHAHLDEDLLCEDA